MKTRAFFLWMSISAAVLALVIGVTPGSALAVSKSVPYCNGWTDVTLTVPAYCPTAGPSNVCPVNPTTTTICTDLFGVGNYANSPLPAGPIDITPTGFTIVDIGGGYTAPTVTVSDALNMPVNPAVCSATLDALGTVTGIPGAITGIICSSAGSGYVAPVVTITDIGCGGAGQPVCGAGATFLAKLDAATARIGLLQGGIRKFVDPLPDLKAALATADTATFPGSDYYEIALVKTTTQMHSDLPPTTVVGYVQLPSGSSSCTTAPLKPYQYLGPVILAQKDRAVRVKFTNCLAPGSAGDLFIPTDTTYMGAGAGPATPANTDCNDPANAASCYQQNRATLHLHGGNTPWISDGTPHQWTVPAGDTGALYKRGVSTAFVPDMFFDTAGKVTTIPQCSSTVTTNCYPNAVPTGLNNDPGLGTMTFYWTNQQGGRLMFYHDHAYGITRLNVYAGEAAGYLLYDLAEEAGLQALTVPGTLSAGDTAHLIPLVIQDKTFVPNAAQLAAQDPTWIWGTGAASGINGNGDLWNTHVYPTNQNPFDPNSTNAFGRWDYGVWFVPGQNVLAAAGTGPLGPNTAVTTSCTSSAFPGMLLEPTAANKFQGGCPIIPNPTGTPESFMDTPLVNGKAYPVLDVNPEAYRFKILTAPNDRSLNLQLYVADSTTATSWNPLGTDIKMLPAFPSLPLCTKINQLTNPGLGTGLVSALLDGNGNPLNGTGYLTNCWPNYGVGFPAKQFMWPVDGRDGGVPDPTTAGPPIIQIGTEGGLLPAAVVIPSTPTNFESNVKSVTVTNVSAHGLWVGPAERADVIIDFSKFAGKTLILYNDAPAPAPAFDMRLDYYTGAPDNTGAGGAPSTVVGYGPNTRTIMQIRVAPGSGNGTFKLSNLVAGLPAIFKATQPPVVVPQPTYPPASGAYAPTTNYVQGFQNTSLTISPAGSAGATSVVGSFTLNSAGSGYSSSATVTIDPPAGCVPPMNCTTATATPKIGVGGAITGITLTNVGAGYSTAPNVAISDPAATPGTGAVATAILASNFSFELKAIQELFTYDYGRMNATLGTEIPFTTFNNQTTLPYGYTDWVTEIVQKDTPQLWYLYHNGVDTHFIHFHLFNVQVVNRIGWDGTVRPPDANELGWKDTVRMNPLENILFAIKPITPVVPFPLPDSIRLQDPTKPEGTSPDMDISGIDPANGNVAANGQTNKLVNFGWEYVWHCHILGHEENDMMRAMIYQNPPAAPSNLLAAAPTILTPGVALTWADNSSSESGFYLQRDTLPTFNSPALTSFTLNGASANTAGFNTLAYAQTVTFMDTSAATGTTYFYRIQAVDDFTPQSPLTAPFQTVPVSSAWSNIASVNANLLTPVVTFTGAPATAAYGTSFNVTATTNSSSVPTITGTTGVCSVGAVSGTAASASATVTMTSGAGTCLLTASWAPDNFFTSATATQTTLATLTAPAVTFTGAPATAAYLSTFTVTATTNAGIAPTSITGNAVCSVGAVSGTSPARALVTMNSGTGACTLTASWPATTNYAAASLTQSTTATLATPLITWPVPAAITYGTALSATQLNATASFNATPLPGTFTYTPAAGSVPAAGNQTLSVTFAPTATVNFASASATVALLVNQAPLIIMASSPAMIYGAPAPVITPLYNGFVNGNTAATALTTPPTCSTTATSTSPVSPPTYPSSCSGALAPNYLISYLPGAVTVNKATSTTVITAHTPNPAIVGQVVTVSFSVAPQFTGIPTGNVTVKASTGQSCTGTLSAGAGSCTMSFTPGGARTLTATYAGNANFLASPVSAAVTQLVSSVDLSTTSLLYGNQLVGTNSARQTVTLTNVGTASLAITSITLGGANAGDYNFTSNCPIGGSLAAGRSCSITPRFSPTVVGIRTATISIADADPTSPQVISLTGTGVAAGLTISPSSLTFASQRRNTTSPAQSVTVSNTGTGLLTGININFSGTNANRFNQTNNCGATLAAGAICTVNVTFRPNAVGSLNALLNVNVAAPGVSKSVPVSGTGI